MSRFSQHRAAWENCSRCPLCKGRKKVVLVRGELPCEVLIIGEGPGASENLLGVPFIGPAGKLLDQIIAEAEKRARITTKKAWSNITGCIPLEDGRKKPEPTTAEILACWDRLDDLIDIAKPQLIVAVGDLANKHAELQHWNKRSQFFTKITHPSFILRTGPEQRGLVIQRVIVTLCDALTNLIPF